MNLGADDRGQLVEENPAGILKLIFPANEMKHIARVVRIERSRELVNALMVTAKGRSDAEATAQLAELRHNLRLDLAEANRAYVEGGPAQSEPASAPTQKSSWKTIRWVQGVLKWMR